MRVPTLPNFAGDDLYSVPPRHGHPTKVRPPVQVEGQGFVPGEALVAEHLNWQLHGIHAQVNRNARLVFELKRVGVDLGWPVGRAAFAPKLGCTLWSNAGNNQIGLLTDHGDDWTTVTVTPSAGTWTCNDVCVRPSDGHIFAVGQNAGDPTAAIYRGTNPFALTEFAILNSGPFYKATIDGVTGDPYLFADSTNRPFFRPSSTSSAITRVAERGAAEPASASSFFAVANGVVVVGFTSGADAAIRYSAAPYATWTQRIIKAGSALQDLRYMPIAKCFGVIARDGSCFTFSDPAGTVTECPSLGIGLLTRGGVFDGGFCGLAGFGASSIQKFAIVEAEPTAVPAVQAVSLNVTDPNDSAITYDGSAVWLRAATTGGSDIAIYRTHRAR